MFELCFIRNSKTSFNGKEYVISQFIDLKNYKVLYGSNLSNADKLIRGAIYKCDVSVSYDNNKNEYKFKVISVK